MKSSEHLAYLKERGVDPARLGGHYFTDGSDLCIPYCDPQGKPYKDSRGNPYRVRRPFPTGKPKFKAPPASGSRPYFSPLMPEGYLDDINIPLVLIEGPVKVDSCFQNIPTGYCFVGLTGTWNIRDHRGEDGITVDPKGETRILPEMKAIPMKGRKVIILFDSDIADNKSVAQAARAIANWARGRGGSPSRVNLPNELDGRKNGADDFLVRHGADQLILKIESSKVIGFPLPSPLLTDDGDIRSDLDPTETEEAIFATAQIADIGVLDSVTRRLFKKLGRSYQELIIQIEEARTQGEDAGFLVTDEKLNQPNIDSCWVVPELLPRGEVTVLAADSDTGKSLLGYDLCRALITGKKWLGFSVPKMRVLILQLEEGACSISRLKAHGFFDFATKGVEWDLGDSFDLAKPRHRQQLQSMIRSGFDFIMVDPLRAVSSLAIDENTAEFGKRVVRRLRKLITEEGGTALIIHHNSRGSGKYAGNGDIKAAVWGLAALRLVDANDTSILHLSTLKVHDGKARDADPILWRLQRTRVESKWDGSDNDCKWELLSMEQFQSPDLPLLKRFEALLEQQTKELTLREIASRLELPDGPDGKVNPTLRTMSAKTALIRQWAIKKRGKTTTYWMPYDRRSIAVQQGIPGSAAFLDNQLTPPTNKGVLRGNQRSTQGEPLVESWPRVNSDPLKSRDIHTPLPNLNGHADAVWDVIDNNPGLHPARLANMIYAETNVEINGSQVLELIKSRPLN
ncbi:AAA family ATPase [Prochlorococcus sp. MIT 1303]|uniref:AAA family ATPase n=1 Tax=Prochlorococcus sp. MIT 1303 TaxID=1723647 RepID=UPI0007B3F9E3|nr:AAA family ATPase [Prochlorococcus sp. MIT 1303]KZR64550.1 hypothetical protein PMIT1303_01595 [Prochlorococcus sp. MIT 1303]